MTRLWFLIPLAFADPIPGDHIAWPDGTMAWDGTRAYHDNGNVAWRAGKAFHASGDVAWVDDIGWHSNGKMAWSRTRCFDLRGTYQGKDRCSWSIGDNARFTVTVGQPDRCTVTIAKHPIDVPCAAKPGSAGAP